MTVEINLLAKPKSIKFDTTPVMVAIDNEIVFSKARAIVTDAHYYILEQGLSGFPEVVESGALYDYERIAAGNIKITNEDGVVYSITRNPGCACGSTLKRSLPEFMGVPYERF